MKGDELFVRVKLFNIGKSIILGFLFTACSVVGYRTTKEPAYKVLKRDGSFEIRETSPMIVAEVSSTEDYDGASEESFKKLANYIFGDNRSKEKISMTAPVFQEKNEKISMTAPVFQEKENNRWVMQFTMPAEYNLKTLPLPIDSDITFREVPSKKIAVIRYSGTLNEKIINLKSRELEKWITANNYSGISSPRSAGYDPPWTIPFLRRNEIQIDIEEPKYEKLSPCPDSPNCVFSSTENPQDSHYISPIRFDGLGENEVHKRLLAAIKELRGDILIDKPDYIKAEFKSNFFKFLDIAEFRIDMDKKEVEIRSAAQSGWYDFGVNRKRIENIRELFPIS